jgi:predicted dehydrogenase
MSLRGAISGFGEVASQAHLAGWRTRPDISIVAIHDPVAERRHHALRLIRNVRVYDDLELMLDGEQLDFVDVASPPAFHAATARMALEASAHVLVEKPLCLDAGEFDELRTAASRSQRVLMCVHNWKHAAAYRVAGEAIRAGRLGEVRYVALDRLRTAPAGVSAGTGGRWRVGAGSNGGILIDHGWHVFYLMRWLMGGSEPSSISAWLGASGDGLAESVAEMRVIFPGERLASAHLSWRAPLRRTRAMIYGSEAALEVEGTQIILTGRSGGSEDLSVRGEIDDSYHSTWFAKVAADFERVVGEGFDSPLAVENLAEARTALALMLGARESHRQDGGTVKLVRI